MNEKRYLLYERDYSRMSGQIMNSLTTGQWSPEEVPQRALHTHAGQVIYFIVLKLIYVPCSGFCNLHSGSDCMLVTPLHWTFSYCVLSCAIKYAPETNRSLPPAPDIKFWNAVDLSFNMLYVVSSAGNRNIHQYLHLSWRKRWIESASNNSWSIARAALWNIKTLANPSICKTLEQTDETVEPGGRFEKTNGTKQRFYKLPNHLPRCFKAILPFSFDIDPNRSYWSAVRNLTNHGKPVKHKLSEEIMSCTNNDKFQ